MNSELLHVEHNRQTKLIDVISCNRKPLQFHLSSYGLISASCLCGTNIPQFASPVQYQIQKDLLCRLISLYFVILSTNKTLYLIYYLLLYLQHLTEENIKPALCHLLGSFLCYPTIELMHFYVFMFSTNISAFLCNLYYIDCYGF